MKADSIPKSSNINHKSYLKDRKLLTNNLKKTQFIYKNNANTANEQAYKIAKKNLKKILSENSFKTLLYSIANIGSILSKNFSNLFVSPQSITMQELKKLTKDLEDKFNTTRYKVDGEELSYQEFIRRSSSESNPAKKEEFQALMEEKMDLLQEDLQNLIIKRNEYAQSKGYKTFFEYTLEKKYNTTEKELEKLITDLYSNNDIKLHLKKIQEIIAQKNNISVNELKPNHFRALQTFCDINKFIEKNPENVFTMTRNLYKQMGFDLEKYEKNNQIIYDLENNKNKNFIYCQKFSNKQVGICAILTQDFTSLSQFTHEMGHAMYNLNTSKLLPFLLKYPPKFINESIALLMESLFYRENVLKEIVPEDILKEYREMASLDRISTIINLIKKYEFEKEIYKNPHQDYKELFNKISINYSNEKSQRKDWFFYYYISHPAYVQNYLRGELLTEKIYNSAKKKLGTELSTNPNTAKFFINNIFKWGGLMNEKLLNFILNL